LTKVNEQQDKEAIGAMYEKSHFREVPSWIPDALQWIPAGVRPRVHPNWFQRRWPAEVWKGVQGRQYHFVAYIVYAVVVAFCLGFPAWLRKRKGSPVDAQAAELPKT
jgi:hypothetical protein